MKLEEFFKVIEPPEGGLDLLEKKLRSASRKKIRGKEARVFGVVAFGMAVLLTIELLPRQSILDKAIEQDDLLVYQLRIKPVKLDWEINP